CNGQPFSKSVVSDTEGRFTLADVPAGARTVHAALGAFTRDTPVTVTAGQTTAIPDDQLCVAQLDTRIAVISGAGDNIGDLLTGLQLQFDTFNGETGNWAASAAPFLKDLQKMKTYDLIFLNCAAAKRSGGSVIDLGPDAQTIVSNLTAYVQSGGSLYGSDWAIVFPVLAFPGKITPALNSASTVATPQDANQFMGYAPQTITSTIVNPQLAAFVGRSTIPIAFPTQPGAQSLHWGLIQRVAADVQVLIEAPTAIRCPTANTSCSAPGTTLQRVPLAVSFKLTPPSERGGYVVYTSFHNIAQPTDDVSKVLKYLVLNL
ncbi:MAG: carboxypeptidase regulatory-like domain-containing protein, partial [Archangium sp.]|nr:carboxypeptidase regulatory-like domain-containing protein [Archangium sp.]